LICPWLILKEPPVSTLVEGDFVDCRAAQHCGIFGAQGRSSTCSVEFHPLDLLGRQRKDDLKVICPANSFYITDGIRRNHQGRERIAHLCTSGEQKEEDHKELAG
jgi:hypothetical protein